MDIQNVFYSLGSFFLILGIAVMIAILVFLWKAYQAIQKTQESIAELKDDVVARVNNFVSSKQSAIAGTLGAGLSTFVLGKVKDAIFKKKKK